MAASFINVWSVSSTPFFGLFALGFAVIVLSGCLPYCSRCWFCAHRRPTLTVVNPSRMENTDFFDVISAAFRSEECAQISDAETRAGVYRRVRLLRQCHRGMRGASTSADRKLTRKARVRSQACPRRLVLAAGLSSIARIPRRAADPQRVPSPQRSQ